MDWFNDPDPEGDKQGAPHIQQASDRVTYRFSTKSEAVYFCTHGTFVLLYGVRYIPGTHFLLAMHSWAPCGGKAQGYGLQLPAVPVYDNP